ncbi:S9 family peptidase [Halorarum salinum]|uniref:S9 family peptidase n=1 Tax=Halorarum salinum TaxID=2743089 RepID=A0A7D5QI69_9EURY|nr:S9 family peptidase [Halobaculum salinum]QLG63443.1 S9 family peptidase [Halobaculum salinum]
MSDTSAPEEGYDIERYLNVRSAHSADFAPDGALAFLMDTTGTPQVWTVEEPGAWPVQRTFYDERVTFVDWSPERRELVFGMDQGGNERVQLYRLVPDTGRIRNLTQRPAAKHRWGGWRSDGDRFAFASNRRDEAAFDVYVQDRDAVGSDAERVYEGDGWLSVAGWSPDDGRLLVHEAHSSFDHDLHALELSSKEFVHLTPHDGNARFLSPEWGPDGDAVYLCTDRDGDTLRLERLSVDTGELTPLVDGDGWNVDGVALDEDTRRLVYSRNVDGYTELTVADLVATDDVEPLSEPDLPRGVAGGVSFADDGDRYALTVTGSTVNANVYVAGTASGATERWTYAATAGIPEDTFVEPELVHYPTFDDRDVPAFFSLPDSPHGDGEGAPGGRAAAEAAPGEQPAGDTPVVVDVHGGPESQRRPSFNGVKQYLLSQGYAVFEPNVRGSSGYGKAYTHLDDVERRMDSVADLRAGVEWLHDHPEVDPDRIAVMGGSYGGFMVLAAMTEYPDLWAAGVDVVGIANFVTFLENTGDWRRELREAEYGSLEEDREFLESISPTNNVDAIAAPLFVLHGENDPRVPVGEAERIVTGARDQGVPVRKLIFEDEGHGFSKLENRIEAYRAVAEFLDEHI